MNNVQFATAIHILTMLGYSWRPDQAIPCALEHRVVYKQLVKS